MSKIISDLVSKYNINPAILNEYQEIFKQADIPILKKQKASKTAQRIIMVSTHGYWENPPPTGLPDTGGQTYYVLEVSKAWAKQGRQVIIIARWFEPYPRVENFAKNLWLIRVQAGGNEFIRKEDIYPLVPQMAEASTAIGALFGAQGVIGHYADGMVGAREVAERLSIPSIVIPHSMGIRKVETLGFNPLSPDTWINEQFNFGTREGFELSALNGSDLEIANTPREPEELKHFYKKEFPHVVMQAGAGKEFFDVFNEKPKAEFLSEYGLSSKKYIIFFGRISESKNVPTTVSVLGEAKKLAPDLFKDIKLVIAGGSRHHLLEEEQKIEEQIKLEMEKYGLSTNDIVRIFGHLDRPVLTAMVHHSLCYLGMQLMEPFGMGVAEAMAAGAPTVISKAAGITKWLKDGEHAIIVDPIDPKATAEQLIKYIKTKNGLKRILVNGHKLAKKEFSWEGIAKQQSILLDKLYNSKDRHLKKGYHRSVPVWRGDLYNWNKLDKKAVNTFCDKISDILSSTDINKRATVRFKEKVQNQSMIAEYLKYTLRERKIGCATVDVSLMGSVELDTIIDCASQRSYPKIFISSYCKSLDKKYKDVPLDLENIDVVILSNLKGHNKVPSEILLNIISLG
ncbi:glycosyltransferase [bacterium]|nr:glycosyltransferase [bacterium]